MYSETKLEDISDNEKTSIDTDFDQSLESTYTDYGITIICAKLHLQKIANLSHHPYGIIISKSIFSRENSQVPFHQGLTSPVSLKFNHITYFDKKDG